MARKRSQIDVSGGMSGVDPGPFLRSRAKQTGDLPCLHSRLESGEEVKAVAILAEAV